MLPDSGRDTCDADLDNTLVIVVLQILRHVRDEPHLVQDICEAILNVLVIQREQVARLWQVFLSQHQQEQLMHGACCNDSSQQLSLHEGITNCWGQKMLRLLGFDH